MPVLKLKSMDKEFQVFPLTVGQGRTIGRKSANDIVIDDMAVSGFHAVIDPVASTFVLRDLDSTNGTFVNQKRITMHHLRHRDVILLGEHELHFDLAETATAGHDSETRVIDGSESSSRLGRKGQGAAADGGRGAGSRSGESGTSFFQKLWRSLFG